TAFCIKFKYLGMSCDLVHLEGTTLLVHLYQLFGSWNELWVEGPDGRPLPPPAVITPADGYESEGKRDPWLDNLEPPLVYPLDVRQLLFLNTAYCDSEDGAQRWLENGIPGPIVFRQARGTGELQPTVEHRAGRPPAAAVPPLSAGTEEYLDLELGT